MTVSPSMILAMSNGVFTVGDTGFITQGAFELYLSQATAQATDDLPSDINSVKKEEAIALLVCHRIERSFGKTDITSESTGGEHSISKKGSGETSWSLAYNDMVMRETSRKKKSVLVLSAEHASTSSTLKFDTTSQIS